MDLQKVEADFEACVCRIGTVVSRTIRRFVSCRHDAFYVTFSRFELVKLDEV